MSEGVVDRLEVVEIEEQHRKRPLVVHACLEFRVEGLDEARAVQEARERVMMGEVAVLALGTHGGDQHPVEAEGGGRHGGQIHRHLEIHDVEERLASERSAGDDGTEAQQDHGPGQPRRSEIAEADAADHRRRRQRRQDGDDPVAARDADDGAKSNAGAPGDREQEMQVGRCWAVSTRAALRADEHDKARQANRDLDDEPGDEWCSLLAAGDHGGDGNGVDRAGGKNRQRTIELGNERGTDVAGHARSRLGQPARQAPAWRTIESLVRLHCRASRIPGANNDDRS
jgi:hypothetical protein